MDHMYWHKQLSEPLFADLIWSRPETKQQAGKLLIVGGNVHGFAAVAEAYNSALKAGIGTTHVILPDALQKIVKHILVRADFVASTPSGSFAKESLAALLEHAEWADGTILAGDFGRNSETAILIETLLQKYSGAVTITKDAADYITNNPRVAIARANTTLVVSLAQLQKIAIQEKFEQPITFAMDLVRLVSWLHDFTTNRPVSIIVKHLDTLLVASSGQVSTTKTTKALEENWRVETAASAAVWWLQNPNKQFEALTSSVFKPNK